MKLPSSAKEIIDWIENGGNPAFIYFWEPTPSPDGQITASCLCQWWPSPFELEGQVYPTAEHYMMAEKARLFGDHETARRILAALTPSEAKALGRTVAGFDNSIWKSHRFEIVVRGNEAKFRQHPILLDYLLSTGYRILVEASPVDPIWGIGLAENDQNAGVPYAWKGLNLLGFALMEVRETLRSDQ